MFIEQGFTVIQSNGDADTLVVSTAIVACSFTNVVVIGEGTDILILLIGEGTDILILLIGECTDILILLIGEGTDILILLIGEGTDILILLIGHYVNNNANDIFFMTDKNVKEKRIWNIRQVKNNLPDKVVDCILPIRAFLVCDTVSRVHLIGKGEESFKKIGLTQKSSIIFLNSTRKREIKY